ncbi:MAG: hypothetical protein K8F91_19250 [Candidatus Obscuribacterales bacterium]|nr:hypothetical protein [Candidatus Obscuribacterales bacterium]
MRVPGRIIQNNFRRGASTIAFSLMLLTGMFARVELMAIAAGPVADSLGKEMDHEQDPEYKQALKNLKLLENRFFFHSYDHDPIEKRVERLELLIFGAAQFGVPIERMTRLKSTVDSRAYKSAKIIAEQNDKAKEPGEAESNEAASSNYPILTTLEWRVLKKTYRKQTIDERLARLETSLFGQPSPAMSYVDRIERLKKVAGIEEPGGAATTVLPRGPMPRAGAVPLPGQLPSYDYNRQFNKDFSQMFKFMNQQMRDMFGTIPYGNNPPFDSENNKVVPKSPYFVMPEIKKRPKLPAYTDPNSI